MTLDTKLGVFGGACGIGAALILFEEGLTPLEAVSILMIAATVLALFMSQHVKRACSMLILNLKSDDYLLVRAEARDIKHILALAIGAFGDGCVTSMEQTRRLLYRNRDIFWVLLSQDHHRHQDSIAGYICMIPMSSDCCHEADKDRFDITSVDTSSLPRQKDPIDGVYIGAVVGTNLRAKSQILGHLITKAEELAQKTAQRAIYARAASRDGLRLVRKHDFMPVKDGKVGLNSLYKKIIDPVEDAGRD